MTHVTYTSHPRVTIEHRVSGPMVVYNKHTETSAAFGRLVVLVTCLMGLVFLGIEIANTWRAGGFAPRAGVLALAVVIPVAGIVSMLIVSRNRVEVVQAGEWLQIRPRPFNFGRGQDVRRAEIVQAQVEVWHGYRVQFVDAAGLGLLPKNNSLSGIASQDEATAVAASVARLFGFHFAPGIQPRAKLSGVWPSEGETPVPGKQDGQSLIRAAEPPAVEIEGDIRLRYSEDGDVVAYRASNTNRITIGAIGVALLVFSLFYTLNLSFDDLGHFIIAIFWIVGLGMLGSVFLIDEFQVEGVEFVHKTRLSRFSIFSARVALNDLACVGLEVYWDSYDKMHHRVVARPKESEDIVLVGDIPVADGHALCVALNKQFGVPI